jgi:hypothetical protein
MPWPACVFTSRAKRIAFDDGHADARVARRRPATESPVVQERSCPTSPTLLLFENRASRERQFERDVADPSIPTPPAKHPSRGALAKGRREHELPPRHPVASRGQWAQGEHPISTQPRYSMPPRHNYCTTLVCRASPRSQAAKSRATSHAMAPRAGVLDRGVEFILAMVQPIVRTNRAPCGRIVQMPQGVSELRPRRRSRRSRTRALRS